VTLSYDLLHERWIPVRLLDGTFDTVSLAGALTGAGDIAGLADAHPMAEVATLRLLVAITQAAIKGPASERARRELYEAGYPHAAVERYLAEHAGAFDLFHPTRPFFQDPDLARVMATENGSRSAREQKTPTPASDLGFPLMAASQKILHSHAHFGSDRHLPPGEAARLLVAYQAWARGGKVQIGGTGRMGVLSGGLVVTPEGRNLAETLLLCAHAASRLGTPVWEGRPVGWLGRLTWPSRRILLFPDSASGLVTSVIIGTGVEPQEKLDENLNPDPMFAYWPSRTGTRKRVLVQPERATWRDITALFQADAQTKAGADVLAEARALLTRTRTGATRMAAVNVYGAHGGAKKDLPALWVRDRFPLPVEFLEPGSEAVVRLSSRLAEADTIDRELLRQLTAAFQRGNASLTFRRRGYQPAVRPRATYWWALETPFRVLLADYARHPRDPIRLDAADTAWAAAVRTAAKDCFRRATQVIALSPRSGEPLIGAEQALDRCLNKTFP